MGIRLPAQEQLNRLRTAQAALDALNDLPAGADQAQLEMQRLAAQRELADARAAADTAIAATRSHLNVQPSTPAPTSVVEDLENNGMRLEDTPIIRPPASTTPTPTTPAPAQPSVVAGTPTTQTPATATPTVTSGATPTSSSPVTPQAVAQRASSDTARVNPPTPAGVAPTGTATAPTTSDNLGPLRLEFEPNPHNAYDRVSYVFKLCMVSDLDAEDPGLLEKFLNNRIRQIVIAESGVTTGFAIGDVEFTDSLSSNFRNRSNITTGLKIQIIEPYGLTLPDRMFQASKELGLRNWRLAPFLLQLEFRYIKQDGTLYTPQGDQKLVRVYQVIITDFDAQLKETGTVYDVQASVKGNLGFTDAYQIIPQSHRINSQQVSDTDRKFGVSTGNSTVDTFFTNLGNKMSTMYRELRENDTQGAKLPILIYKFIVADRELGRQEINFSPEATARRASYSTGSANVADILVHRGQSVTALVDDIMASLKDPTFFFQDSNTNRLVKIPVIECVTKNVGWDLITNDYVREFTFFIRTKLTNRAVPTEQYGSAIQNSANLQLARLQDIKKTLRKRYDYFYTGNNTEIISCDIKFNQLHVIPQPLLQVTMNVTASSAERVNPNNTPTTNVSDELAQERQQLLALESRRTQLDADRGGGFATEEELFQERFSIDIQQRIIQERIQAIARESVITFEGNTTELNDFLAPITDRSERGDRLRQALRAVTARNAQLAGRREFAEDLRIPIVENMLQLSYHADPRDILNSMTRPVTQDGGPSPSTNPRPTDTRAVVSSILQQIYDKSTQHLLEIDLEIRGDPYWLGTTDLERSKELLTILQNLTSEAPTAGAAPVTSTPSTPPRVNTVDKYEQDANILLKFRSGVAPDTRTGFMNLTDESTFFYGVYTVIECVHEFKSGKFTQRLKAFRDALINLDMLRQADSIQISATQPSQVPAATPANAGSGYYRTLEDAQAGAASYRSAADFVRANPNLYLPAEQTAAFRLEAAANREVTRLRGPNQTPLASNNVPPTE